MTEQTRMLCGAIPQFADYYREYDAQGHDWVIVTWRQHDSKSVTLNDVSAPEKFEFPGYRRANSFSSRTATLRASEIISRMHTDRTEDGHWGVWM